MPTTYELNAWLKEGGSRTPFYLRISEACRSPGGEDYYCCVHAPGFFEKDKEIFGIDQAQARELAVRFVKSMLIDKHLIDEAGRRFDLDRIR